jgi:hypothetical protein
LAATWSKNVWSTVKPVAATTIAGSSVWNSDMVPYSSSASAQPRTVPGTPADSPLNRASLKGSGAPSTQNESGAIAAGAVSRWSMVVTFPSRAR